MGRGPQEESFVGLDVFSSVYVRALQRRTPPFGGLLSPPKRKPLNLIGFRLLPPLGSPTTDADRKFGCLSPVHNDRTS